MQIWNAEQTAAALPWRPLIEALREGLQGSVSAPLRHHHSVAIPDEQPATLLLMPAWTSGHYLGLKQVLVVPENSKRNLAAVAANYYLNDATSGQALAVIDGNVLTHRRTASVSALAADYLARQDADHLLMIGTGGLAPSLVRAHAAVRSYARVSIWGRDFNKAQSLQKNLSDLATEVVAVESLESVIGDADVISCATLSCEPLVRGAAVKSSAHVDLVGAFTPTMRESDDELLRRARLFVDSREGALAEAGDIVQAIESGAIEEQAIVADIKQLCAGTHSGRRGDEETTVFKMVGTAEEDLITAQFLWESR